MPSAAVVVYGHTAARVRRKLIAAWARRLREEVARGREFCCLLTDDRELRRLNRRHRGKDRPTDVLSFPARAGGSLGDIAVSTGRARRQAREHGHSVEEEIGILMLHGLLHLLGMDHERDRGQMMRAEMRWRRRLGLPAGLTERAA
jgi:probable rRNA maturation factor